MPMVDCSTCHRIGGDQVGNCQACGGRGQVWVDEEENGEDDEPA